ncbi:manganese ABC transporter ATP-binding protein [Pontibacillus chungwhensis BH030062]|uniref:Manganese ABC transporter ATP-binding protein n=1 Tax=Pontibacillus chungwhensis BH030062 TaxID=1385513 RepID=A0A0A2UQ46_9BACI|nr:MULTISPECIES: metal ABC transporter ATP-binding protein [Pontibacillus]KGP90387.1 manganese ABC transporter ATP-binding protein [Pontibacillus chungwhensis BH030062]QST00563.1 metal ABC transporter ATP-binding protein [Pontibacillus sp. ALD_SL1]
MKAIEIQNLAVTYERQPVLENVNFTIPEGTLTGIIGPNGAGKSTLIKSILHLIPRLSGDVVVYGKPYKKQRNLIGYVPQRSEVDWDFPTNALDVVLMGRYGHIGWIRRPNKKEIQFAYECLEKVGMKEFANRQISQLSGGQQQRVFLARALAQDAQIYFMDEPFAGVDAATEKAIMKLLQEWREQGKTVLVVHHDLQTVKDYFDHCLLLNKTPVDYGPTESVFTLDNLERTYGGAISFLGNSPILTQGG